MSVMQAEGAGAKQASVGDQKQRRRSRIPPGIRTCFITLQLDAVGGRGRGAMKTSEKEENDGRRDRGKTREQARSRQWGVGSTQSGVGWGWVGGRDLAPFENTDRGETTEDKTRLTPVNPPFHSREQS